MKCMVIIFVRDVCMSVCMYVEKINMISARGITGVASHGLVSIHGPPNM